MEKIPNELQYTQTHEWIRFEDDGTVVVGITEFAKDQLGELVFVDLPDIGILVHASDDVCVVESVKAASDIFSPVSGRIIAVNEDLEESPNLVNTDPYGDGWLFKLEPQDPEEFSELLSADDYAAHIEEDED